MSDYVHNKVIRLPITNEILKSFDCQDVDEFVDGFHKFVKKYILKWSILDRMHPTSKLDIQIIMTEII